MRDLRADIKISNPNGLLIFMARVDKKDANYLCNDTPFHR